MAYKAGFISNEALDEMTEQERHQLERMAGCTFVKYDVNSAHDVDNNEALNSVKSKINAIMHESFNPFTRNELNKVYNQYDRNENDLQKLVELNNKLFMIKIEYAKMFWTKNNLLNATFAMWAGTEQKGYSYFTKETDPDHKQEVEEYETILKENVFNEPKPSKVLETLAKAACKIEEARANWRIKLQKAGRELQPNFVWATK